jgi:hypothetical protein
MNAYPTLAQLAVMDEQAVFDHVARHLLVQRQRSELRKQCLYRDGRGHACAVGALIPPGCYARDMEQRDLFSLIQWCGGSKLPGQFALACFLFRHQVLLRRLQYLHDSCDPACWPDRLRDLALGRHLRADVIAAMTGMRTQPMNAKGQYAGYADAGFRSLMVSIEHKPAHMPAPVAEVEVNHAFV